MTSPQTTAEIFLAFSRDKLLNQYWPRLRTIVEPLTPEQIWWRPNPASNSMGNLMLHLNGNVGQWLVASFNRQPDHRDRPAEFNQTRIIPAAELLEKLAATDLPNLWKPRPDQFFHIDALPYLGTGKLDLRKVREMAGKFSAG